MGILPITLDGAWDGVVSGKLHQCSVCRKSEVWGPTWAWYGSWRDFEDGKPILKFCSAACIEKMPEVAAERDKALRDKAQYETDSKLAILDNEADELKIRLREIAREKAATKKVRTPTPGGAW